MPGSHALKRSSTFLTVLTLCASPLLAQAGTFTGWHLNGNASLLDNDDTLRIVPLGSFRVGSAWALTQLSLLEDFSVAFSFRIGGGSGADGFTLTFQSNDDGSTTLGSNGGFLGYQGIERSVAFIYDTFDNGFDTDRAPGDNTSVIADGDLANGWGGNTVGTVIADDTNGGSLRDAVLYSWIDYDASLGRFDMFLNDVATKPGSPVENIASDWSLRLGDSVFVGFTAGTGSLDDNHDILSFSVTTSPVPLPGAAWLLGSGVLGLAGLARRRR